TRKLPDPMSCLERWRMFLDRSGVAGSVLYPTMGLAMAHIKDAKWAAVTARCYNDYLYGEYLQEEPQRLRGVALLPIQDIMAAAEELERCVSELGMVGGVIPAAGLPKGLGHPMYDPLYQTAVRLKVPLAVHGGSSQGLGLELYDSFVKILVMEHAIAQQIHFTSYILDGAPVRFPTLKIAFLEAGVGWVPYLIERLDEKYEKLPQQAPLLDKEPSHYIKNCPIYFTCELEERIIPYVIGLGLEKKLMYPSDYPHERPTLEEFLRDLPRFHAREDISEQVKKFILRDNCIEFYSLTNVA
ncbi:MAG: amidohydrolase family protein, partial [Deltaproteobacteria bacterium]|nr:amidohydrolase family protein [Deltaproteobacteria bacterium]